MENYEILNTRTILRRPVISVLRRQLSAKLIKPVHFWLVSGYRSEDLQTWSASRPSQTLGTYIAFSHRIGELYRFGELNS